MFLCITRLCYPPYKNSLIVGVPSILLNKLVTVFGCIKQERCELPRLGQCWQSTSKLQVLLIGPSSLRFTRHIPVWGHQNICKKLLCIFSCLVEFLMGYMERWMPHRSEIALTKIIIVKAIISPQHLNTWDVVGEVVSLWRKNSSGSYQ